MFTNVVACGHVARTENIEWLESGDPRLLPVSYLSPPPCYLHLISINIAEALNYPLRVPVEQLDARVIKKLPVHVSMKIYYFLLDLPQEALPISLLHIAIVLAHESASKAKGCFLISKCLSMENSVHQCPASLPLAATCFCCQNYC